jgi:hypothetical protein
VGRALIAWLIDLPEEERRAALARNPELAPMLLKQAQRELRRHERDERRQRR